MNKSCQNIHEASYVEIGLTRQQCEEKCVENASILGFSTKKFDCNFAIWVSNRVFESECHLLESCRAIQKSFSILFRKKQKWAIPKSFKQMEYF